LQKLSFAEVMPEETAGAGQMRRVFFKRYALSPCRDPSTIFAGLPSGSVAPSALTSSFGWRGQTDVLPRDQDLLNRDLQIRAYHGPVRLLGFDGAWRPGVS
jgi:hypothetical protein